MTCIENKVKVQQWNNTINKPIGEAIYVTKSSNVLKLALKGLCGWRILNNEKEKTA